MAVGQNLRYLFSRDYHLFKRPFKGHRGYGVLTHSHMRKPAVPKGQGWRKQLNLPMFNENGLLLEGPLMPLGI